MKILLVGEYSGVHTELAKALNRLGHEVLTVSDGDSYKNFPRDITITRKRAESKLGIIRDIIYEYLGVKGLITYFINLNKIKSMSGYDVVQIINPIALEAFGSIANILFINRLSKNNNSLYLCALGDDSRWVDACLNNKYKYSPLDMLSYKTIYKFSYSLRYKYGLFFTLLQRVAEKEAHKIIPGLLDYKIAYENVDKCTQIIKIPLPKETIDKAMSLRELDCLHPTNRLKIFHGWQQGKELKKGNLIFNEAALNVKKNFGDLVEYKVVKSVPYDEYLRMLDDSDIFLDQTYSYDRGVNALIGMASGCVVFSGFEDVPNYSIGINATPDVISIESEIEKVIESPEEMHNIKMKSLDYIINNHNPDVIAQQYINVWRSDYE